MPARESYDVVIVGAGPIGLATACHLREREPSVSMLVVDARSGPGEGSMGASNAMARDVFSSRDNHLLAKSSIAFYRRLMEEREELRAPVPLLDLYGYLWLLPERLHREFLDLVGRSGGSIDAVPVDLDGLRSCPGLVPSPARWYDGDGAPPPEPITAGLFGRNCGAIAPELLVRYYHGEALRQGVEFAFDTVVQRLSFEGREEILLHESSRRPFAFQERMAGRLRIARVGFGDGRSVRTDRVIVAAGAWAERILHPLGVATGCSPRPQSLYSVSGAAVDDLLAWEPPVHPIDPGVRGSRFPFVILPTGANLKPVFRERRIWVGLEDTIAQPIGTREDPGRDGRLDFDMARLADRAAYATDVLPAVAPYFPRFETTSVRLENAWAGYYHFSPDGLPVLVDTPFGVTFVGGDSGSGVMKADALGRLAAAQYEGRSDGQLFGGESYRLDRLSLSARDVKEERIIL
jgi:FAD-dependent oxidoreductase domain-containing protein 1